jgi:photosystem II stability/assembly factor-like uncharacterized protein
MRIKSNSAIAAALGALIAWITVACDQANNEPEDYGPWRVYYFNQLPENVNIESVFMLSNFIGWATADGPQILKYENGKWFIYKDVVVAGGKVSFDRIDFLNPTEGWAVGAKFIGEPPPRAFIMRYDGQDWKEVPTPPDMYALTSVEALAADDVWVGGAGGIWHYDGSSWTCTAAVNFVRALYFNSPDDGWATADFGLYLHWNGSSWEQSRSAGDVEAREDIFFPTPEEGWAVGGGFDIGEIPAEYPIFHYAAAAGRWEPWPHPAEAGKKRLYGVHFASADDGWAAGQVILRWDGSSWRHIPCPFVAFDVFTLGGDEVWLACDDRKILKYDPK